MRPVIAQNQAYLQNLNNNRCCSDTTKYKLILTSIAIQTLAVGIFTYMYIVPNLTPEFSMPFNVLFSLGMSFLSAIPIIGIHKQIAECCHFDLQEQVSSVRESVNSTFENSTRLACFGLGSFCFAISSEFL